MFVIQVSKKKIQQQLRRLWRQRVQAWKAMGSKGRKPKLYEVTEDVLAKGFEHFETPAVDSLGYFKDAAGLTTTHGE